MRGYPQLTHIVGKSGCLRDFGPRIFFQIGTVVFLFKFNYYLISKILHPLTRAWWRSGYRARLEILFLRERQFESGPRRSFCRFLGHHKLEGVYRLFAVLANFLRHGETRRTSGLALHEYRRTRKRVTHTIQCHHVLSRIRFVSAPISAISRD